MHLEKLVIQGFKSFATKNELNFPHPKEGKKGITSIVGPNGSGKSNIADAVRWALGEQSMKTLRGKKSEDVIFSGSDKKGKLGMAEVSLHLNNEDSKAPIDYSEIVLTRRLFRDGESEYLINNSKSRLSDIQMLLAKASFGQKTYSVIGQGTVEGFLNTSLAERKEFFDEATGVKQFQIKRDDSLNKLRQSYENLHQAKFLCAEIEPRLKSLTKQVKRLERRGELEIELEGLELDYYAKVWHEINKSYNEYNKNYLELDEVRHRKAEKLEALNKEHADRESGSTDRRELEGWQKELAEFQYRRDSAMKRLAAIEAKIELKLESQGKFDLSWLQKKKSEIKETIEKLDQEKKQLENKLTADKKAQKKLWDNIKAVEADIKALNEQIRKAGATIGNVEARQIADDLGRSLEKLAQCEIEYDMEKIKAVLREIRIELSELASLAGQFGLKEDISKIQENLLIKTEEKERLGSELAELTLDIRTNDAQLAFTVSEMEKAVREEKDIENKLVQMQGGDDNGVLEREQSELAASLNNINQSIETIRDKVQKRAAEEDAKRRYLFGLHRNIQAIQQELSQLSGRLNDLKVNAARYETRLEDLEAEIRENGVKLKAVKETEPKIGLRERETKERIQNIKRQLEMIGGIDVEVVKEYGDTKERYDFLNGQTTDLSTAIDSLEKIIKELDVAIKEKFDKEFKVIAGKFEEYFKILFNGGNAKIIKVMEKDLDKEEGAEPDETAGANGQPVKSSDIAGSVIGGLDLKKIKFLQKHNATGLAGIEIQATPPGKKIKSISMLSGGERALTAIALISAIISANPSPFVVLDEVDAALDEANSERLAKILDDLSGKTQFIVITHNRASMRRASVLYGVTMQDDGVSKLLSVKLEDAEKAAK